MLSVDDCCTQVSARVSSVRTETSANPSTPIPCKLSAGRRLSTPLRLGRPIRTPRRDESRHNSWTLLHVRIDTEFWLEACVFHGGLIAPKRRAAPRWHPGRLRPNSRRGEALRSRRQLLASIQRELQSCSSLPRWSRSWTCARRREVPFVAMYPPLARAGLPRPR